MMKLLFWHKTTVVERDKTTQDLEYVRNLAVSNSGDQLAKMNGLQYLISQLLIKKSITSKDIDSIVGKIKNG